MWKKGAAESEICEKHIPVILNECDYFPLWKETQRLGQYSTREDNLDAESRKYGECVHNRFKRRFSVYPMRGAVHGQQSPFSGASMG